MRIAALAALLALLAACDTKPSSTTPTPPTAAPVATAPAPEASKDAPQGEMTYYFGVKITHTKITFQSKNDLTDILGESNYVTGSAKINFAAGSGTCPSPPPP